MPENTKVMVMGGHTEDFHEFKGFERPITWVKPYGRGRVLFTALGHDKEQTENPNSQRLIVNGVRWAVGPGVEEQ